MKNIITLIILCFVITCAYSQAPPQAFNYSAVARNAANQPIVNTNLGILITILKNSSTGPAQYQESHVVTTDQFGLINLIVGGGSIISGSMAAINWSNDNYYIQIGLDVTGGSTYTTMGTTQLLSVPYALHAGEASSVVGGGSNGFVNYPGKVLGGGVVFHVYLDATGTEHCLIADLSDLSSAQEWSNVAAPIGVNARKLSNGNANSNAIISQAGHTASAANLCLNSTAGGETDWYLPSINELQLLWNNLFEVNKTLSITGGATEIGGYKYWSSTEFNSGDANSLDFQSGANAYMQYPKQMLNYVRAVRVF